MEFYEHFIIFILFPESSSQEHREKKDKDNKPDTSSSESGNDDNVGGAQSKDNTNPSHKSRMDYINRYFEQLGLSVDKHNQILKTVDFDGLVDHWNEHGFKNIITMVGAGISTCKWRELS